jgi:hypothetical protein
MGKKTKEARSKLLSMVKLIRELKILIELCCQNISKIMAIEPVTTAKSQA